MKYSNHKISAMTKRILFSLAAAIAACGISSASTLIVSATGQFSGSDVADSPLVTPNGVFSLSFVVDSNPTPLSGSVTSFGFDVPVEDFSYQLNHVAINLSPSEITFFTLADGGLFSATLGSGLSSLNFQFEGAQAFSGTTAAPAFATGNYSITGWTYSDPSNFDSETPLATSASIAAAPEPSTIFPILGGLMLLALEIRKRQLTTKRS